MKFILEIRKRDIRKLEEYFMSVDIELKGIEAIKACFWLPGGLRDAEVDLRDDIEIRPVQRKLLRGKKERSCREA